MHRTLREQIENRCIHFTGLFNKTECAAGIAYPLNRPERLVCFKDEGGLLECPMRHFPSEEKIQKELSDIEDSNKRMSLIYPIIGRIKKDHKGHDWSGEELCPACGGSLYLSHASLNGHVWGKCSTPNCVAWME